MSQVGEAEEPEGEWMGSETFRVPVRSYLPSGDHNVVADDQSRCHDGSNVGVTVLSKEEGGDVGQPTFENLDLEHSV